MVQKDVQIEELRQRKTNSSPTSAEDVEQYTQTLVEALAGATAIASKHKEVHDMLNKLANSSTIEEGHIFQNRLDRLWTVERLREMSVEFQRLKLDRLKNLDGSSEIRKEFIRSVQPLQLHLDRLLHFNQGILNCKLAEPSISHTRPLRVSTQRAE